jgi:ferredoxin
VVSDASDKLHRVVLLAADGTQLEFDASGRHSLVKAAALAGVRVTSGCLQGRCAICRARLLRGQVTPLRGPSKHGAGNGPLWADGTILLCSVAATSDIEIAPLSPWRACAPL